METCAISSASTGTSRQSINSQFPPLDIEMICVIIVLLRHNGGAVGAGWNRADATMSARQLMSTPRKRRGDCTIYDWSPEFRKLKERDDRFKMEELELLAFAMRDDSLWEDLTGEQRGKVYEWLFEENLTYAQTAERIKSEFGRQTSVSSVGRMFRCMVRTWQRGELIEAHNYAENVNNVYGTTREMREATVKMLAAQAVRRATEKSESLGNLLALSKTLLSSEENEIRLRRVKLEEQTLDFKFAMAGSDQVLKVKQWLQKVQKDRQMKSSDKEEQIRNVKEYLFGSDKPEGSDSPDKAGKGGGESEFSE